MKRIGSLGWVVCGWAMLAVGQVGAADVRPLEFIHALQNKDYSDKALEYIEMLKAAPEGLPADLKSVYDLEVSKCYRGQAARAYNAEEFDELMNNAQKYLDKFLKENATHPEAVTASFNWANFSVDRALQHLRVAQSLTDPKDAKTQAEHFEEARKNLKDAKPRFAQAIPKFLERVKALPPAPASARTKEDRKALDQRDQVEGDYFSAIFQAALCDYYISQTYADKKAKERVEALKTAAAAFDDVHQRKRVTSAGTVDPIGLYAHMWNGRCHDEMGNSQLAEDIYDEVLANVDAGMAGLEPLFAQVESFRLQILKNKEKSPRKYVEEASEWLKTNKNLGNTDGYQMIALDLAKTYLKLSETATAAEKDRLMRMARELLSNIVKVRSAVQKEAIVLRMTVTKGEVSDVAKVERFAEAVALADAAAAGKQWDEALKGYQRAMELSSQEKDKAVVAKVNEQLNAVRLMQAYGLLGDGKVEDCLKLAGTIVKDMVATPAGVNSPTAPAAASLAIQAALNLYVTAPADKRDAALERLMNIANFTIEKWPGKPEADEARINLGRASLAQGQVDKALSTFEAVNPNSERYASALQLAGRTYWWRYLSERQKKAQNAAFNEKQLEADHKRAVELLTKSYALQMKAAQRGPMSRDLQDTVLALANVYVDEAKKPDGTSDLAKLAEAAKYFQQLIDAMKANREGGFDATMLQIFVGAVNAYTQLSQLDKAGAAGAQLLESGPDNPQVNSVLIRFAATLNDQRKKADAEVAGGNAAKTAERDGLNKTVNDLMRKLATRKEQNLSGLVYIADTLMATGSIAEAEKLYTDIGKRAQEDPVFAGQSSAAAMNRVRSQLAGIMRKKAEESADEKEARDLYTQALVQVNALMEATKNKALEPWMEKGRILQSRGQKFKNAEHYKEGRDHWAQLRGLLENMKIKGKRPPEFYEVTYNLAECMFKYGNGMQGSQREKAVEQWTDAEKILKGTLIPAPKLSGEDMVVKYKTLLQQLAKKQGREYIDPTPGAAPAKPAEAKPAEGKPGEAAKPAADAKGAAAPKADAKKK